MMDEAIVTGDIADTFLSSSRAAKIFQDLDLAFTPEERRTVAHVKRFLELLMGDSDFRAEIKSGRVIEATKARNVDIDPEQLRPFFDASCVSSMQENPEAWPLLRLWQRRMTELLRSRTAMREDARTVEACPELDAWRLRQIRRNDSEIGETNNGAIVHPLFAFELSKGCTVGCWFCGISAAKFQGYVAYTPENAELWQGVLRAAQRIVGDALRTGFCYWATDPLDNPDYPNFLKDYFQISGALPQTTTAAPLKNIAMTREVIALQRRHRSVVNRFSITSLKTLREVHAEFAPEEILDVELVMQHKESIGRKALAGAALKQYEKLKTSGREKTLPHLGDSYGTIACVSGFLVSMFDRHVRLVAPCRASSAYPDGYKVYAEGTFETADDFERLCRQIIRDQMPLVLPSDQLMAFRAGLNYEALPDGFSLSNEFGTSAFDAQPFLRELGALIAEGTHTADEIQSSLLDQGADIFTVVTTMQNLFEDGLLAEPIDLRRSAGRADA